MLDRLLGRPGQGHLRSDEEPLTVDIPDVIRARCRYMHWFMPSEAPPDP